MSSVEAGAGGGAGALTTASVTSTVAKITTSNISATPIALNSASTTAIRTIGAGGQATQVRVVMPTNLMAAPSMIKQLESAAAAAAAASGRTQITAMPTAASVAARTMSNTSITVARPITQTAYLPRASVTATQMTGVGVATTATGQRLVTPIRATPATGATVAGLTAGGSFVRSATAAGGAVSRNTTSPATTVISPASSTTWMAANNAGQVQLIRAISHQPRQRIVTTQNLSNITTGNNAASGGVGVASTGAANVLSGTVVAATTIGGVNTVTGNPTVNAQTTQQQQQQAQTAAGQATLQSVASSTGQQPTYVATLATVLPPRQHQATLVYSSNVGNATVASGGSAPQPAGTVTQTLAQTQPFSPTLTTGQRFAVATSLTAAANATGAGASRQIRQIPLTKQISTTKLSTASISIRAPNLPQLAPTIATGTCASISTAAATANAITSAAATVAARSGTVTGVTGSTATASVIPGANLSATRIIQLQQQPGGTAQQIIGTGRLAANVMLQPFIVNTTVGSKIGLRPPVTMAAKGQPSLTITHMGISKLPTSVAGATLAAQGAQAPSVNANLQGLNSSGATNLSSGTSTATAAGGILTAGVGGIVTASAGSPVMTNIASAAAAGLLTAQNIVTSAAAVGGSGVSVSGAGATTVVPLAITTRGGTLTSIKNANGITVGKVMTPTINTAVGVSGGNTSDNASTGNTTPTGTSVFIQQQQQRPGSAGLSGVTLATATVSQPTSSSTSATSVATTPTSSTSSAGVVTSSAAAFLPPGSTIYYESVPASTVQSSTGVLSITTTTLTSSTMSQQQITTTASNSCSIGNGITTTTTALPYVAGGGNVINSTNSATSFTVVPTNVGNNPRTIGQLQLPVASSSGGNTNIGAHIQAVRFSTPLAAAVTDATANVAQQQVLMAAQVSTGGAGGSGNVTATTSQHMVIPLQTSIKVTTTTSGAAGSTVVSNFLRKRDNIAGSTDVSLPLRAAKNLAPTLLSMGAATASSSPSSVSSTSSSTLGAMSIAAATSITAASTSSATIATIMPPTLSPTPSTSSSFSTVSSTAGFVGNATSTSGGGGAPSSLLNVTTTPLTVEALAKKERTMNNALASTPSRCSRGASPASSDGSTTVSANSSPGVEQQMAQDDNSAAGGSHTNNTHFNPIHELYPSHHQQQLPKQHTTLMMTDDVQQQHGTMQQSHGSAHRNPLDGQQTMHLAGAATGTSMSGNNNMPIQRLNGGIVLYGGEGPPRKRSRRGTNDSQQSNQSQPSSSSFSLPPPAGTTGHNIEYNANTGSNSGNAGVQSDDMVSTNNNNYTSTNQHKSNVNATTTQQAGNKENAKPVEYYLRRPRNCSLISTYKTNWKSANNHFQRYTDVKQREERRPTVIDVANQVNIQNKLGGWKVYHLRAQMEDLAENEESSYDHLNEMLKQMESHEKTSDTERICDLLKGNIQRNKIIVDGINEAKNQIMKIFDHQTHVSDILSRCASKRNFKKRDKV